jgi:hypothetical protein
MCDTACTCSYFTLYRFKGPNDSVSSPYQKVFAKELPFFSLSVPDAVAQLRAGISPCPPEQYFRMDPRVLSVVRPTLALDPTARPCARDVLKDVSKLL